MSGESDSDPPASTSLADALFPKVRQRVLAVLFGNPGRSFYAKKVIASAGSGSGAVQRELAGLSQAGLLTVSRQGNQRHYQANAEAPVFAELRGLGPEASRCKAGRMTPACCPAWSTHS